MKTMQMIGVVAATAMAIAAAPASAQKNYTEGGDLYGGAHAQSASKKNGKAPADKTGQASGAQRSGKFDPYTEGTRSNAAHANPPQKFPDERPQPDDVAKSGKAGGQAQPK